MAEQPIRVLLADDDPLVCQSLKVIIEADTGLSVVGVGRDGEDVIRLFSELNPDVVLLDIRMKPKDGLEAGESILARDPQARLLYLTTFSDDAYIIRALQMGAYGYILKQDFACIVPAIKAVLSGQNVFGSDVMNRIPDLLRRTSCTDFSAYHLSDREVDLIHLVAEGLNNREIAGRLFLSEGTVRNQISGILEKLGLRDRTQLAVFYYKQGR